MLLELDLVQLQVLLILLVLSQIEEGMSKKKKFRIRTKKFFLTYPQLPKGKEDTFAEIAISHYEFVFSTPRDEFSYLC